jgi:membrane-associated protease RseP (regulator of RpoE activity)
MQARALYEMRFIDNVWIASFLFMVALIFILGSHELAHKITAMRHKIAASWPYFIPMPLFIIGTMGALISIKSPIPTRKAAIRLGLSGPLVGFIAAIIVLAIGLTISPVVPTGEYMEQAEAFEEAHPESYGVGFGATPIFTLLGSLLLDVPEGYTFIMHPMVVAAIVGIFVTALNLIPMGQLDGGHIARSILGQRKHMILSKMIAFSLMGLGAAGLIFRYNIWIGWMLWGFLGYFISSRGHPGAMDEVTPLTGKDKLLALIALAIFILCFTPTPLYVVP